MAKRSLIEARICSMGGKEHSILGNSLLYTFDTFKAKEVVTHIMLSAGILLPL